MTNYNYFFLFILGLSIGSFLNVLIDRLPAGESILGRSHCDHCKKKLGVVDLIPVVSWLLLGAKCRHCNKKISAYYPIAEAVTGLAFVFVFSSHYPLSTLGIISSLIVVLFADFKYHLIPDEATVTVVLFSLPIVFVNKLIIANLVAGFGLMLSLYFLYYITKGRGMGFGDVKLAGAMGFLLGFKGGFLALYIAFIIGGVCSLALILFKKSGLKNKIAFGPFLVIGTVTMLFWNREVMEVVSRLFGF